MTQESDNSVDLYGSLTTEFDTHSVSTFFEKLGWQVRKISWTEYEIESAGIELEIVKDDKAVLLSGSLNDISEIDQVIAVLELNNVNYHLELYNQEKELIKELSC